MYCQRCGTLNDDRAETCISCGNSLARINEKPPEKPAPSNYINYNNGSDASYDKVPNYLVWSIIVTVVSLFLLNFLALPAGIAAIVFSTQVDSKLRVGDYDGAVKSSKNAKIWNWVATGLEILSVILIAVFLILIIIGFTQYQY